MTTHFGFAARTFAVVVASIVFGSAMATTVGCSSASETPFEADTPIPAPAPMFGSDFVILAQKPVPAPFFATKADIGGDALVASYELGSAFDRWEDFHSDLGRMMRKRREAAANAGTGAETDGETTGESNGPAVPKLRDPEAAKRAVWNLIRHMTGDAAWERPDAFVEFDEPGTRMTVRHTEAVHAKIRAMLAAIAEAPELSTVTVNVRVLAIDPAAMAAFETFAPLPTSNGLQTWADRPGVDALLARLSEPNKKLADINLSLLPGREASMVTVRERTYVRHFGKIETPAGTGDVPLDPAPVYDPDVAVDRRGFAFNVRALPLREAGVIALAFEMEIGPALPMIAYPLKGGDLVAHQPQGEIIEIADISAVKPGQTLVILVPGAIPTDNDGHQFLLLLLSPAIATPPAR